MLGSVSSRSWFVVEGGVIRFITGVGGLLRKMIVEKGLLSNVAHIILNWVIMMLFSDFKAQGLRCIPKPPMTAITEFFDADAETNVYPLPVSWYFKSSSLW